MTTQRDRLAAVLHEADRERWPNAPDDEGWYWEWMADALLARGVRVVDAETLAAALAHVQGGSYASWLGRTPGILAALDGESRTENDTETTSDAEDDDGPVRWIWNIPRKEADR